MIGQKRFTSNEYQLKKETNLVKTEGKNAKLMSFLNFS